MRGGRPRGWRWRGIAVLLESCWLHYDGPSLCDHPSGVGARVPVGSLPCGYLANLCPVWLPDGSLSRCISGVAAKTRGKVTFFFCIISPFREVFDPLLANCALIYLLHNSLKSKNIANFAPANALVAELVDAPDLGSGVSRRAGSSPVRRTILNPNYLIISGWDFCFYIFAEFCRVIKRLPVQASAKVS